MRKNKKSEASSLASDFLFDECPDMSKKHLSADCEYTEAGESSRVYDVGKIMSQARLPLIFYLTNVRI